MEALYPHIPAFVIMSSINALMVHFRDRTTTAEAIKIYVTGFILLCVIQQLFGG